MSGSRQNSLQQQIDNTTAGGILQLIPGEYAGPIAITKAITLVGNNATIWALEGPVLTIDADVSLQGLRVEVTGEYSGEAASTNETAIAVSAAKAVVFNEVSVRGNVIGVPAEAGIWRYPRSVNLGILKSRCSHKFLITIMVPINCRLDCSGISGLRAESIDLATGLNDIMLDLDATVSHAMIYGNICLKTDLLQRYITISASIADTGTVMNGQTAWQPTDLSQLNELTAPKQFPQHTEPLSEPQAMLLAKQAISQAVTQLMTVIPVNPHDNDDQQTKDSNTGDAVNSAPNPIAVSNPGNTGLSSPAASVSPPVNIKHTVNSTVGKIFGQANIDKSNPISSSQSSPEVTDNGEFKNKSSKRIKGNNFINPNLWTGK